MNLVKTIMERTLSELEKVDGEPEPSFETGAWEIAEVVCRMQLIRSDGSIAKGLQRIGTRSFNNWVDVVEKAIEQENPEQ